MTDEHVVDPGTGTPSGRTPRTPPAAPHISTTTPTHTCEIVADVTLSGSYVMVALLSPDEDQDDHVRRYIDRLEKRDDPWRIAVRRSTIDTVSTGDASMLHHPLFRSQGYIRGTRDRSDVSYQRRVTRRRTRSLPRRHRDRGQRGSKTDADLHIPLGRVGEI